MKHARLQVLFEAELLEVERQAALDHLQVVGAVQVGEPRRKQLRVGLADQLAALLPVTSRHRFAKM